MEDEPRRERVKRWLDRLHRSRKALWLLFVASFLETIVVPIPIELVLIPFMLTNRHRLWRTATVVTAGCLAASVLGYGVGYWLFESVGRWAIESLGWQEGYEQFRALFAAHGFWAILAIGVVPIPFQTAMLAAGAAAYPVHMFVLAATIARGIRYFGLAALVRATGDRAIRLWRRHRLLASVSLLALIAGFFLLSHWLGAIVTGGSGGG